MCSVSWKQREPTWVRSVAGLVDNFAFGTLELSDGVQLDVIDTHDNDGSGYNAPPEALYVGTLRLGVGTRLLLQGVNLYYIFLDNQGGTIRGTGQAAAIPLGAEPTIARTAATRSAQESVHFV